MYGHMYISANIIIIIIIIIRTSIQEKNSCILTIFLLQRAQSHQLLITFIYISVLFLQIVVAG